MSCSSRPVPDASEDGCVTITCSLASTRMSPNQTCDDLPGAGRLIDTYIYQPAGRYLERRINRFLKLRKTRKLTTARSATGAMWIGDTSEELAGHTDMTAPVTVPCQYRTGKMLGSGTHAVVKEAVHIKTDEYYACKVTNKTLLDGLKYMVRNEILILKRISKGHKNIITLHDYFETIHNVYLCFDICTGGELLGRIRAKGNYYERDAVDLVRTILGAVDYIHECDIVHRNLKPDNMLFRTKAEDADIMITDFWSSRVMNKNNLQSLTDVCGTPGYIAPEVIRKTGHGKPVDIWAMGVITYLLLCGHMPFGRDTQEQELQAVLKGNYAFEPEEYWMYVSESARDFVRACLTQDPAKRPTAREALKHPWLASETSYFLPDPENAEDLLLTIQKGFDAKETFRKAALRKMPIHETLMPANEGTSNQSPHVQELATVNIVQCINDVQRETGDGMDTIVRRPVVRRALTF